MKTFFRAAFLWLAFALPANAQIFGAPAPSTWLDFANNYQTGGCGLNFYYCVTPTQSAGGNNGGYVTNADGTLTFVSTAPRTNLTVRSQEMNDVAWSIDGGNGTITANTTVAPDGMLNADTWVGTGGTVLHRLFWPAASTSSGQPYTASIFVSRSSDRYVQLVLDSTPFGVLSVNFDLETCKAVGSSGTFDNADGQLAPGNFCRIWVTKTATGSASATFNAYINQISSATASRNSSTTAGRSTIVFGAQYEIATAPTEYIPTGASAVTTTGALRIGRGTGLLAEEARTNLVLRSQEIDNAAWSKTDITVTANAFVAPDGTLTGELETEGSAGTSGTLGASSVTISAGATISASAYFKAGTVSNWIRFLVGTGGAFSNGFRGWLNTSNCTVGNSTLLGTGSIISSSAETSSGGWCRLKIVGTGDPAATTANVTWVGAAGDSTGARVNGANYGVWGVQIEQAVAPSSYIPTTDASVTRVADQYVPAGPLLSAITATQGSIVMRLDSVIPNLNNAYIFSLNGSTDAFARAPSSTTFTSRVAGSSVGTATLGSNNWSTSGPNKIATKWNTAGIANVANNGTIVTSATPFGAASNPWIGSQNGSQNFVNSPITTIATFASALPDATLQALTTPCSTSDPSALALVAAMTTKPDCPRQRIIQNSIVGLKNECRIWDKFGAFWRYAAHTSQASLLNWKNPATFTSTLVNSPVFTVDRGYAGNAANAWINTNFVPGTDGDAVGMTFSNSMYAARNLLDIAADTGRLIGNSTNGSPTARIALTPRTATGSNIVFSINTSVFTAGVPNADARGFYIVERTGSSASAVYKDAALLDTSTNVSTNRPTVATSFLADIQPLFYSSLQIASGYIGVALTANEKACLAANDNTYMSAVGAL